MLNRATDKNLKFQGFFLCAHLASASSEKTTLKGSNLLFLCSSCLLLNCAGPMEREGRKHVQASKAILKNTPICLNAGLNLQPFTHFIIVFIKGQKHAAYLHPRDG